MRRAAEDGASRPDGLSRLSARFAAAQRPLFMPFAVAGHPDVATSLRVISTYRDAGADLVELGIPWATPVADGPVIAAASREAAARGLGVAASLKLAADAAVEGIDVVLLAYAASVPLADPGAFFADCGRAGVVGVVLPDLPPSETGLVAAAAAACGIAFVGFLTPSSPPQRVAEVGAAASGFVYCASTSGRTGGRGRLSPGLPAFLARVRAATSLPLAVGFGVSTPAQAARVAASAECVVVGSVLVAEITAAGANADLAGVGAAARALSAAVHEAGRAVASGAEQATTL